ncbi:flagellar export protein FliJ [Bowmanella sp. JS7-9]|uniref:Flagellar FliJ protein n=1 Tax=Pseudobowmanella zhangzhouensis TaxID=1537679 RepID=A0ABW1XL26_9ALTE|nr:flagellar export protein FliJ [Bowmanella sp. JS7-9]TBX25854.1 flagellar export protein FliJ [Bowmanella sp. JS7-9]
MSNRQLHLVARWEQEKEHKCAQDLQVAEQHWQQQKQKLSALQGYRNTYLSDLQKRGMQGLDARAFSQHHGFLAKLDKACDEQSQQIARAKLVVDQRRQLFLQQQKKRKAVDMLLERKAIEAARKEQRAEQALMDEVATQRFIRRQLQS